MHEFSNGALGISILGRGLVDGLPQIEDEDVLLFDPEWLFHHGEGGDIIAVSLGETPVALEPSEGSLTPGTDVHQIGDVVSSGDVVLAVVGWESRPGQEAQSPLPAGMRFVVVDLVLVNQGQRALQVKQLGLKDQTGEAGVLCRMQEPGQDEEQTQRRLECQNPPGLFSLFRHDQSDQKRTRKSGNQSIQHGGDPFDQRVSISNVTVVHVFMIGMRRGSGRLHPRQRIHSF